MLHRALTMRPRKHPQAPPTRASVSNTPSAPRAESLDAATIREVSVRADVDPRSVLKHIRGGKVRGMAGRRIARTLRAMGLERDWG